MKNQYRTIMLKFKCRGDIEWYEKPKCISSECYLVNNMITCSGSRPYQCSDCDESFSNTDEFINHLGIHSGKKPYWCSHCYLFLKGISNITHIHVSIATCLSCHMSFYNFKINNKSKLI
ncbi:unnamed protein product [Meganyctiphanes norvegica]|uniref:C2H2-type domain-containing protein n=1 Tax=Meganyctiphanes norvegica TaxID=48144 RepID=A0AAV2STZ2_MEGNR